VASNSSLAAYLIVRAILSKMPDKPDDGFEFENKTGT